MTEAHGIIHDREVRAKQRVYDEQHAAMCKLLAAIGTCGLQDQMTVLRTTIVLNPDVFGMRCMQDWIEQNAQRAMRAVLKGEV